MHLAPLTTSDCRVLAGLRPLSCLTVQRLSHLSAEFECYTVHVQQEEECGVLYAMLETARWR